MSFRKIAVIYNPRSGQRHASRTAKIDAIMAALQSAGVPAEAVPTRGPGTAGDQAREAVVAGCDAVFACGGDGTVHEVLQGMVGSTATLGVVPLGTANSLAVDIGVPRDPTRAIATLLAASPTRMAVGQVEYQRRDGTRACRYFTVAAGIGPDAHLFYSLNHVAKRHFGYAAYYAEALRMWAMHAYPWFEVEFTETGASSPRRELVSQLLAVRITNFGGLLRRLAPGAALKRNDLRLVLFKTRSRARYLRYVTSVMLGRAPRVPCIELVNASAISCRPAESGSARIHVEADGELLGELPVQMRVVENAATLLIPRR